EDAPPLVAAAGAGPAGGAGLVGVVRRPVEAGLEPLTAVVGVVVVDVGGGPGVAEAPGEVGGEEGEVAAVRLAPGDDHAPPERPVAVEDEQRDGVVDDEPVLELDELAAGVALLLGGGGVARGRAEGAVEEGAQARRRHGVEGGEAGG